jgi:hypothetical protein
MAGVVALGLGIAGATASTVSTINANNQAQQTQAQETQLLNEATQQQQQQAEQSTLISQRNSQEALLNPVNPKFSGSNTILTGPLGIPPAANSAKPAALLGT